MWSAIRDTGCHRITEVPQVFSAEMVNGIHRLDMFAGHLVKVLIRKFDNFIYIFVVRKIRYTYQLKFV